jgi:hypothetical protein
MVTDPTNCTLIFISLNILRFALLLNLTYSYLFFFSKDLQYLPLKKAYLYVMCWQTTP